MAFKMKNQSMAKLTKAAGDSRVAMKMKAESAMKMKKESAMKKELVGKQGNLPPELKAKIEAAPSKMKSAMKKNGDNDAKMKALKDRLAKAIKEGNDREVNAIRRQLKDMYESEKEGKGLEKSPAKMKEKSAMKMDDEMDRLMEIKRNTDPNDRDAVREINEKIRAYTRKIGVKDVPNEEKGKMKEKSAMKKDLPEVRITEKKKEKKKGPRKVTKDLKYPYSKNKFGDLMYKDALVNKREAAKIPDSELYEYNPVKPTKTVDSAVPMKMKKK